MKYTFPKIDLHLHLDGSFRTSTLWHLAKERNIQMPVSTQEEYEKYIQKHQNASSVNEYLEMFDTPLLVMQDEESISRITYELIEDLALEGHIYDEIRFAPQLHAHKDLSQEDALLAVLKGREKALKKYPEIKIGILCCMMSAGLPSNNHEENLATVELTKKYLGKGVVGIDLAGVEGIVPLHEFGDLFARAREYKLPMTCHAGDSQGPDTVSDAINFGVTRIGHGHHIFQDKELCKLAIDKGITLEICPTSNIQCKTEPSYQEHPAFALYSMGLNVTINTDNRTFSGVTIDDEYDHCLNEMGFSYTDLIKMNIMAVKASFCKEEEKEIFIAELEKALNEKQ